MKHIFWFSFVWTFIYYTSLWNWVQFLSSYLQNNCLFFPRFILIILLNTNVDDHQIEVTLSFKFHDIYHQLKINEFDISCSDLFEIYITDTQMLDVVNYIRNISTKKVTYIKLSLILTLFRIGDPKRLPLPVFPL